MKKLTIVIVSVVLALTFLSGGFVAFKQILTCPKGYGDGVTVSENFEIDTEALKLVKADLDRYKGFYSCGESWLSDYRIDSFYKIQTSENEYVYRLEYSVKPAWFLSHDGYWIAGNGIEKSGWIERKLTDIYITKAGNKLQITNKGLG